MATPSNSSNSGILLKSDLFLKSLQEIGSFLQDFEKRTDKSGPRDEHLRKVVSKLGVLLERNKDLRFLPSDVSGLTGTIKAIHTVLDRCGTSASVLNEKFKTIFPHLADPVPIFKIEHMLVDDGIKLIVAFNKYIVYQLEPTFPYDISDEDRIREICKAFGIDRADKTSKELSHDLEHVITNIKKEFETFIEQNPKTEVAEKFLTEIKNKPAPIREIYLNYFLCLACGERSRFLLTAFIKLARDEPLVNYEKPAELAIFHDFAEFFYFFAPNYPARLVNIPIIIKEELITLVKSKISPYLIEEFNKVFDFPDLRDLVIKQNAVLKEFKCADSLEEAKKLVAEYGTIFLKFHMYRDDTELEPSRVGAAECVLAQELFEIAEYYLWLDGFDSFVSYPIAYLNNLHRHPFLRATLTEWLLEKAPDLEKKKETLCEMALVFSASGCKKEIEWICKKTAELDITIPAYNVYKEIIEKEFHDLIPLLSLRFTLSDREKSDLIDFAIEKFNFEVLDLLLVNNFIPNEHQIKLKNEKANLYAKTKESIDKIWKGKTPQPLNEPHMKGFGLEGTQKIFESEYRKIVCKIVNHLKNSFHSPDTFPQAILEMAATGRRRIAIASNTTLPHLFGQRRKPLKKRRIEYTTPFSKMHAYYKKKAEKEERPVEIERGDYTLTQRDSDEWIHLDVIHLEEMMPIVHWNLLNAIENKPVDKETLRINIAAFHWIFSHTMPYERGSAAIAEMITDALWLYHDISPPDKVKGINLDCEALISTEEQFVAEYPNFKVDETLLE